MSSQSHADRFSRMLASLGYTQAVDTQFRENQVTVLFRVSQGADAAWNVMMDKLFTAEEQQTEGSPVWRIDISKKYMHNKQSKLVFGWRFSVLSTDDISKTLDAVNAVIKGEPIPVDRGGEIMEMPFSGMEGMTEHNKPKPGSRKGVLKINDKSHPLRGEGD